MFLTLLGVTFIVSFIVCFIVAKLFAKPIDSVLERIIADEIASAWTKYLQFAIYVVGISGGVEIRYLERFIRATTEDFTPPALTAERWILEIYRAVIETLQSIAFMLLVFFIFALIAYVIVRVCEFRSGNGD